jgi:hypothetical protein
MGMYSNLRKWITPDKLEEIFGKSIYVLYIYYFVLTILIGANPSNDIVTDILRVAIWYLIPLTLFVGIYLLIVVITLYHKIKYKVEITIKTFIITVKVVIAIIPIFYFNDNLARVLLMINHLWR